MVLVGVVVVVALCLGLSEPAFEVGDLMV